MPSTNFSDEGQTARFGRLVTLYDMLTLLAAPFVEANNCLARFGQFLTDAPPTERFRLSHTEFARFKSAASNFHDACIDLDLSTCAASAARLRDLFGRLEADASNLEMVAIAPKDSMLVRQYVDQINNRISDELGKRIFLVVPIAKLDYYEPKVPLFGAAVDTAFPSTAFDISEAGKCFAIGRETACVMHVMRALESPLQLLGNNLGVKTTRENWGNLLNEIDPAIIALKGADPRKTDYSEAAIQFRHIKVAWRDHAMHARGKYTPDEAMSAFTAARDLMNALSRRLSE